MNIALLTIEVQVSQWIQTYFAVSKLDPAAICFTPIPMPFD
jgi:hypothetical protein